MESNNRNNGNDNQRNNITSSNDGAVVLATLTNRGYRTDSFELNFFAILLCVEGQCSIDINGSLITIYSNDMIALSPSMFIANGYCSPDFKCHCIICTPEYMNRLFSIDYAWNIMYSTEHNPVFKLSDDEAEMMTKYFSLIETRIKESKSKHIDKIIDFLLIALTYEFDILKNQAKSSLKSESTSANYLFNKFINLINTTNPKRQTVAHYANELCITPKYLSAICSKVCGKHAEDIINSYVISDVKRELARSKMSVKEIAFELGFNDASSFGKFVKRHLGVSPKDFRKKFH